MGRELVWPFFCFLPFIFPVIMSALQYLMTAHLFRQFQVASLLGEGMRWQQKDCVFFFLFMSHCRREAKNPQKNKSARCLKY